MCLHRSKEMCQSMLSTHTIQKSPNASIILNKEPMRKKKLFGNVALNEMFRIFRAVSRLMSMCIGHKN